MADIVIINPRFEISFWGMEHCIGLLEPTSSGVSPALRSCFTLRILLWLFGSAFQWREDMTIGVGNLVAIICIVISIIFAIVTNQATNALWWALLAIFAVLWWGARAPWGTS